MAAPKRIPQVVEGQPRTAARQHHVRRAAHTPPVVAARIGCRHAFGVARGAESARGCPGQRRVRALSRPARPVPASASVGRRVGRLQRARRADGRHEMRRQIRQRVERRQPHRAVALAVQRDDCQRFERLGAALVAQPPRSTPPPRMPRRRRRRSAPAVPGLQRARIVSALEGRQGRRPRWDGGAGVGEADERRNSRARPMTRRRATAASRGSASRAKSFQEASDLARGHLLGRLPLLSEDPGQPMLRRYRTIIGIDRASWPTGSVPGDRTAPMIAMMRTANLKFFQGSRRSRARASPGTARAPASGTRART